MDEGAKKHYWKMSEAKRIAEGRLDPNPKWTAEQEMSNYPWTLDKRGWIVNEIISPIYCLIDNLLIKLKIKRQK